jgi:hypothetical protein
MAVVETHVAPFVLTHPLIQIGDDTTGVQIQCMANEVKVEVDQDENKTETFCGSYTSYKAEVWTITITALQSFGADGLETLVRPLVGTIQPFKLNGSADDPPDTVDNPTLSGDALVKAFDWMTAAVGETSDFDLVLAVQGQPTETPPGTPLP